MINRISILITSLGKGGAERFVSEISNSFPDDIDYEIITLDPDSVYELKKERISFNVPVISKSRMRFARGVIAGIIKYRRYLRKRNPNISWSILLLDNIVNISANLFRNDCRIICSVRSVITKKLTGRPIPDFFIKMIISFVYNRADLIIAVSNGVKNELVTVFNIDSQKIHVIYNPVNSDKIKTLATQQPQHPWFSENIPIIISVGRLTRAKGHWHLIRAFSEVKLKCSCRLVIIGEGELRESLQNLVDQLGLSDDIQLIGWQSNPYMFIARSTMFVLSSDWDAMPNVLIEAMACGCPVISADCDYGPREIIKDGEFGILVPPMNIGLNEKFSCISKEEKCLASGIFDLLNDLDLQEKYRVIGYERAKEFELANIQKKYVQLLGNI